MGTFPFFGTGLSEPTAADGRFGAETFLLASGMVGLALRGDLHGGNTCVQVWARRDEEGVGGGGNVPDVGAAARVWGMRRRPNDGGGDRWNRVGRGRMGCQRARPSPDLRRRPCGGGDLVVERRGAG
jgi:hypothetical protein